MEGPPKVARETKEAPTKLWTEASVPPARSPGSCWRSECLDGWIAYGAEVAPCGLCRPDARLSGKPRPARTAEPRQLPARSRDILDRARAAITDPTAAPAPEPDLGPSERAAALAARAKARKHRFLTIPQPPASAAGGDG